MMRKLKLQSHLLIVLFLVLSSIESQGSACYELFKDQNKILSLESFVSDYSLWVPGISELISFAQTYDKKPSTTGYCYKAVKKLLMDFGIVHKRPEGTFASSAHTKNFLKDLGFINILNVEPFKSRIQGALDPHIPAGAILVFEGTNGLDGSLRELGKGIGHIEIKCGPFCYIHESRQNLPSNGLFKNEGEWQAGEGPHQRRLIAVYILDYFSLF